MAPDEFISVPNPRRGCKPSHRSVGKQESGISLGIINKSNWSWNKSPQELEGRCNVREGSKHHFPASKTLELTLQGH